MNRCERRWGEREWKNISGSFSTCAGEEAQAERRAAMLIPLLSPLTREDLRRFPVHVWRNTSLSSPSLLPFISPLFWRAPPIPPPHPQSRQEGGNPVCEGFSKPPNAHKHTHTSGMPTQACPSVPVTTQRPVAHYLKRRCLSKPSNAKNA